MIKFIEAIDMKHAFLSFLFFSFSQSINISIFIPHASAKITGATNPMKFLEVNNIIIIIIFLVGFPFEKNNFFRD